MAIAVPFDLAHEFEANAQIGGSWTIAGKKKFTRSLLKISGKLEVPLSSQMRGIVRPIAGAENEKLVGKYIASRVKIFGGEKK